MKFLMNLIALVMLSFVLKAQSPILPKTLPSPKTNGYSEIGYYRADSGWLSGQRDTLWQPPANVGAMVFWQNNYWGRDIVSNYWYRFGTSADLNGYLKKSDSTLYVTISKLKSDSTVLRTLINGKLNISDTASMLSAYLRKIDTASLSNRINDRLKYSDTSLMLSPYLRKLDTASLSARINLKADKATTININGVTQDLSTNRTYSVGTLIGSDTVSLSNRINQKVGYSDTASMLSPYTKGVGTAEYIPKFSDTKNIINSIMYNRLFGGSVSGSDIIVGRNPITASSARMAVTDSISLTIGGHHGFGDYSVVSQIGNGSAYATFDGKTNLYGPGDWDHHVAFQARSLFTGSGKITNYLRGGDVFLIHNGTDTVNEYAGWRIGDLSGSGKVKNSYGLYIENISRGYSDNKAIYVAGGSSQFNGLVGIATNPLRLFDLSSNADKTNSGPIAVAYLGKSTDAVNYSALDLSFIGAATQATRSYTLQMIEQGVANAGTISLQPNGGNVGIGIVQALYKFHLVGDGYFGNNILYPNAPVGSAADSLVGKKADGTLTYGNANRFGLFNGSGTLNYIPKFSGTTVLANSIMYSRAANMGITGTDIILGTNPISGSAARMAISDTIELTNNGHHSFGDYSYIKQTNNDNAYAVFDGKPTIGGAFNWDHHVVFQARSNYMGSGNINNYLRGGDVFLVHNGAGTIANYEGWHIGDLSGSGAVTNSTGLYIDNITRGSSRNNAIYVAGGKSFFGGGVGIGTQPIRLFDLSSNADKTNTSSNPVAYLGKSTDVTNYSGIDFSAIGAATAANRVWTFQTIEQGVANAGNISFQRFGGQVLIGTATPDKMLTVNGEITSQGNTITGKTETPGTNNTTMASTAFVQAAVSGATDTITYNTGLTNYGRSKFFADSLDRTHPLSITPLANGYRIVQQGLDSVAITNLTFGQTVLSGNTSSNVAKYSGNLSASYDDNTLVQKSYVPQSLKVFKTDSSNSGTSETSIYQYFLPVNKLSADDQSLEIVYGGTFTGLLTATKRLRLLFGTTEIFTSGTVTLAALGDWRFNVTLIRTGNTTARAIVGIHYNTGSSTSTYSKETDITGLDLAATSYPVYIAATSAGVGAATGDITAKLGRIQFIPAP